MGHTLRTKKEIIPRMQIEARHFELVQLVMHRALGPIVSSIFIAKHRRHYVFVNIVKVGGNRT